jgi:hypothetical protein
MTPVARAIAVVAVTPTARASRRSCDSACGKGGQRCDVCASDEVCKAGVCEDKPPVYYSVILYGASFKNNSCREGFLEVPFFEGECDVHAKVSMAGYSVKARKKQGDNSPVWNKFLFKLKDETILSKPVHVTFKDADLLWDDNLRSCSRSFEQKHLDEGRAVFTGCGKAKSVVFLLKK